MATRKKKTFKPRPGGYSENTKFIMSLPATLSTEEVIAKGKAAGLALNQKLVWGTRARLRWRVAKNGHAPEYAPAAPVKTKKLKRVPASAASAVEDEHADFMRMVLDIGYRKAASLLVEFRDTYMDGLKR